MSERRWQMCLYCSGMGTVKKWGADDEEACRACNGAGRRLVGWTLADYTIGEAQALIRTIDAMGWLDWQEAEFPDDPPAPRKDGTT